MSLDEYLVGSIIRQSRTCLVVLELSPKWPESSLWVQKTKTISNDCKLELLSFQVTVSTASPPNATRIPLARYPVTQCAWPNMQSRTVKSLSLNDLTRHLLLSCRL